MNSGIILIAIISTVLSIALMYFNVLKKSKGACTTPKEKEDKSQKPKNDRSVELWDPKFSKATF